MPAAKLLLGLAGALLVAAHNRPVQAQEMGRLFFTPQQREALDARRKARIPDRPTEKLVESPTARLDGRVERSGGRSTVWVNGTPVPEGAETEGVRVLPRKNSPATASIAIGEERAVELRVGETVDRGTGEVKSDLGSGKMQIERSGGRR